MLLDISKLTFNNASRLCKPASDTCIVISDNPASRKPPAPETNAALS